MRNTLWMVGLLAALSLGCERQSLAAQPEPAPLVDGEIQVRLLLPASVDPCLNQSLKDLGVGAKRDSEARSWTLDPRKIHAALVPSGQVQVVGQLTGEKLQMQTQVRWKGPLAAPAREELERRLVSLTERIGFYCDQRGLPVECLSGASGALIACAAGGR
ncbi:MAG: hypothetical protein M3Y59_23840 [Myxococcota bacterium]|nr:hypothetical protein [Myxococcota bacterium]